MTNAENIRWGIIGCGRIAEKFVKSMAVVADGDRLFTMYRDAGHEVVIAVDRSDGRTLWEHRYAAEVTPSYSLDTSYGEGPG